MFGVRGNNDRGGGESLSSVVTPENPPKSKGGNVTGFDPEGLERAAKAARELDSSRNASSAIELIKTQEVTKQVNQSYIFFLDGRGGKTGSSMTISIAKKNRTTKFDRSHQPRVSFFCCAFLFFEMIVTYIMDMDNLSMHSLWVILA